MSDYRSENGLSRRTFLAGTAATTAGLAAAGSLATRPSQALAQAKSGVVRVWGEPGPYAGVAVDGMNEWAQKNAPGLKFEIETISWGSVYVKLMTDLAAGQPANLISVESPLAYQLMAEGLLGAGRRRHRHHRSRPYDRRHQVGILGELESKTICGARPPSAASSDGAHGHHQRTRPAQPRYLDLGRPPERRQDHLREEEDGRHRPSPRAQPGDRLFLRGSPAFGRRPDVRRRQQFRGRLRQPGDGRDPRIHRPAAAIHAAGRHGVQLPAGGGFDGHGRGRNGLLLGPRLRPRRRGGTGDIQEHRVLQSRASSPHRQPVQLERLPGLGHSEAEQPVHRRSQASGGLLPDQARMADPLCSLAGPQRFARVQGRGRGSADSWTIPSSKRRRTPS